MDQLTPTAGQPISGVQRPVAPAPRMDDPVVPPPVRMDHVFTLLCVVMRSGLLELPDILHVDDVAMNYADGNYVLAWQQMVELLGIYYGRPIRGV